MSSGLNRRIKKADKESDPDVEYSYYYNTDWPGVSGVEPQIVEVRKDGAANPYKQFVWDLRYIDAPVLRWRDTNTDGTVDDTLYYTNDHPSPSTSSGLRRAGANMNITALVNTSGAVVERYSYDPYGRVTVRHGVIDADGQDTSADEWTERTAETFENNILYAGYVWDPKVGLFHVRNRTYHPTLGRWLQRDPAGYVDGMSVYEYLSGMPTRGVDPLGTAFIDTSEAPSYDGSSRDPLSINPQPSNNDLDPMKPLRDDWESGQRRANEIAVVLGIPTLPETPFPEDDPLLIPPPDGKCYWLTCCANYFYYLDKLTDEYAHILDMLSETVKELTSLQSTVSVFERAYRTRIDAEGSENLFKAMWAETNVAALVAIAVDQAYRASGYSEILVRRGGGGKFVKVVTGHAKALKALKSTVVVYAIADWAKNVVLRIWDLTAMTKALDTVSRFRVDVFTLNNALTRQNMAYTEYTVGVMDRRLAEAKELRLQEWDFAVDSARCTDMKLAVEDEYKEIKQRRKLMETDKRTKWDPAIDGAEKALRKLADIEKIDL